MKELLASLTLKEKIGQLTQLAPFLLMRDIHVEIAGYVRHLNLDEEKIFSIGSILGIGSAQDMIQVQTKYLEKSRHKIPLLFMSDIIHGYKTIFPVPLAMSTSFRPELAKLAARISAKEAATAGIHVTFSPMADVSRDPRWGRVVEGFGEDPLLAGNFAAAMVEGYQGDDLKKEDSIASCVKHFAGYGASESGRDYNSVDISRISLFQTYLPAYKKAIEAGARMIMTAFNTLDYIPCTTNKFLLRDVLRTLWRFDGVTISDYDSLQQTIAHGYSEDQKEAAKEGILAGLDIEMASTCYLSHVEDLIAKGELSLELIDEAVFRILQLKQDIGLFENPYKGANAALEEQLVYSKEHMDATLKVAHESIVLLKNNDVLPLKDNVKIALIGPYSESRSTVGPWSWHGRRDFHPTLAETLEKQLVYVNSKESMELFTPEEIHQLRQADIILCAIGEKERESGEAHSKTDLALPRNQASLIKLAKELQKPCVVLLHHGRPLLLDSIQEADAILDVFFLGSSHAQAVKDVLHGYVNPSGKLTMSYPRHGGQIPVYYNTLNTGRPYLGKDDHNEYVSKYLDCENTPLYAFGHGLSYANFIYSNLQLSRETLTKNQTLSASIDVHNDSNREGYETILLFLRDHVGRIVRPVMELKGYQKVHFKAHERKTIEFEIDESMLEYYLDNGVRLKEAGWFTVFIGKSSDSYLKKMFHYQP